MFIMRMVLEVRIVAWHTMLLLLLMLIFQSLNLFNLMDPLNSTIQIGEY